jgi:hypothetical protein
VPDAVQAPGGHLRWWYCCRASGAALRVTPLACAVVGRTPWEMPAVGVAPGAMCATGQVDEDHEQMPRRACVPRAWRRSCPGHLGRHPCELPCRSLRTAEWNEGTAFLSAPLPPLPHHPSRTPCSPAPLLPPSSARRVLPPAALPARPQDSHRAGQVNCLNSKGP